MALRVAIYVRQSVKEDEGIEQQIKHIRATVTAREWEAIEPPYIDNFVSASKDRGHGTAWARMLSDYDDGKFDVLMGVSVDRLLRRVTDVLEVTGPRRPKLRVVTARDGVDTGVALGKIVLTILVALAEGEIETKTERMKPYAASRRAAGHPTPGRVPYGYRWRTAQERKASGDESRYSIEPDEAANVRLIFDMLLREVKVGEIRTILNGQTKNVEGKPVQVRKWGRSTITRMAMNPLYAALLPPKMPEDQKHYDGRLVNIDECSAGAWPPIVEADQVRAARELLLQPDRRSNGGVSYRKWLLSGLATCSTCRTPVSSAWTKEKMRGYRCPRGHFQRRAEIIDEYVIAAVIERLSQPDAAGLLQPPIDPSKPSVTDLRTRRLVLQGDSRQLLRWHDEKLFEPAEIELRQRRIQTELLDIEAQLTESARVNPLAAFGDGVDAAAVWEELLLSQRRHILSALCGEILITPVGKGTRVDSLEKVKATVLINWRKSGHMATPSLFGGAIDFDLLPNLTDEQRQAVQASSMAQSTGTGPAPE
jgi:site-specific DNA recombinase